MKATMLAEISYSFWILYAPWQSADMSQVSVASF
jgi:hypothetical protein